MKQLQKTLNKIGVKDVLMRETPAFEERESFHWIEIKNVTELPFEIVMKILAMNFKKVIVYDDYSETVIKQNSDFFDNIQRGKLGIYPSKSTYEVTRIKYETFKVEADSVNDAENQIIQMELGEIPPMRPEHINTELKTNETAPCKHEWRVVDPMAIPELEKCKKCGEMIG